MNVTNRSNRPGARAAAVACVLLAGACMPPRLLAAGPGANTAAGNPGHEFDCLLAPSQTVEIRSPVSGLIEHVHAQRGSVVKKGAALVSLESSVERAATDLARFKSVVKGPMDSADSRLVHAERKLRRRTDLATQSFISAQDRDDAEAEHRIAQADALTARENRQQATLELAYANAQLGLRQLRSPVDGVVVEQSMFPGELAEIGENRPSILKLAQINPLYVKAILPMALFTRVKVGQRAEVVPEKPMEGRYIATITMVDKVIDAASGTFQARIDLPNANGALPSGVKCRVTLPGL